jgi:methionyl-tRNA formyltransferase
MPSEVDAAARAQRGAKPRTEWEQWPARPGTLADLMPPPLRIAFFGTPEFAAPAFERLLAGPHRVVVAVTQPDRPRGRGRKLALGPVAERARSANVPLLQPERVGSAEVVGEIARHGPDLGVVVAFGQFLPRGVRELPRLGYLINGHASLLPRHRGAAPIQHAILCGDAETGVSVMRVEREMDAGAVMLVKHTPIGANEDSGALFERLALLTAAALAEALDEIAAGRAAWTEQDHARASFAPKIESADAELDFTQGAAALARRVRAMSPRPGARAHLDGDILRVLAAHAEPGEVDAAPGTIRRAGDALRVATSAGWLALGRLQRAGGKPLATAELLRGFAIADGARFATPPPRASEDDG